MRRDVERTSFLSIIVIVIIKFTVQVLILILVTEPPRFFPAGNGYWIIVDLSRGNELPNAFRDRSRWPECPQENILQGGQHFCHPAPYELLQGRRNMLCIFLG